MAQVTEIVEMTCPDCERYKTSASMWRNEAYRLGGAPLPWDADELIEKAVKAEREANIKIIEEYRIPVGNSSAGEMACEWTYDALKEIRDEIRARGEK